MKNLLYLLLFVSTACFSQRISDLPAATTPVAGTEVFPIVQSGITKKVSITDATASKAPLASPTFTGTPAAPTAATTTSTTQIATTAFVQQEIDARVEERTYKFTDEITPITATTGKLSFYWPFNSTTITSVWIGLGTVQTSGSTFTVDVNKNNTTILSTKLTIDNTESTSLTAATAPVLSVTTLDKGDKVTIDVDQIGDTTAKGAELHIEYTRP